MVNYLVYSGLLLAMPGLPPLAALVIARWPPWRFRISAIRAWSSTAEFEPAQHVAAWPDWQKARIAYIAARPPAPETTMPLKIAVQMDHVSTVSIAGDTSFALSLEAQRRGHKLFHYTPDRLSLARRQGFRAHRGNEGARREGQPLLARRAGPRRPLGDGRGAAAPGSALRHELHHHHAHPRAHPSEDAGGQRPGLGAQQPGEDLRHRIPRPDAGDADHQGSARGRRLSASSSATSSSSRSTAMAAPASSTCTRPTATSPRCSKCSARCSASPSSCSAI